MPTFEVTGRAVFVDPEDHDVRDVSFDGDTVEADTVEEALLQAGDYYLQENLNCESLEDVENIGGDVYLNDLNHDEEKGTGNYALTTQAGSSVKVSIKRK
jgi:hypothetical protein